MEANHKNVASFVVVITLTPAVHFGNSLVKE
jgi:hypothetical protein